MRPKQLKTLIKMAILNNQNLLITGKPGIGKTEICKQVTEEVCRELDGDYMITHPVMQDPTEYAGLGFPSEDRKSAEFLPYGHLLKMINAEKLLVVIIDDLGQAALATQAALMQLIQERNVNGKKISPHVRFLACTNRKSDKAGVQMILEPLKSRNTIIELTVNGDDFRLWGNENGMPPELIAFTKLRPGVLEDFEPTSDMTQSPNPRNVARVGKWQAAGLPKDLEYETYAGCIGEKYATEYVAFLKTYREMPDPEQWIKDPNKPLPQEESVCYALAAALCHMATKKNVDNVFKIAMRMDAEYSTFLVYSMVQRDKKLAESPGMAEWATKYSPYLL